MGIHPAVVLPAAPLRDVLSRRDPSRPADDAAFISIDGCACILQPSLAATARLLCDCFQPGWRISSLVRFAVTSTCPCSPVPKAPKGCCLPCCDNRRRGADVRVRCGGEYSVERIGFDKASGLAWPGLVGACAARVLPGFLAVSFVSLALQLALRQALQVRCAVLQAWQPALRLSSV